MGLLIQGGGCGDQNVLLREHFIFSPHCPTQGQCFPPLSFLPPQVGSSWGKRKLQLEPNGKGMQRGMEHLLLGWKPPPLPAPIPWPTVFFAASSFLNSILIDKTSMGQADPVFSL